MHNQFVIKSSESALPGGRKWGLICYPAGNGKCRKNVLILMLRLTGGAARVNYRVSIKESNLSLNDNFDLKKNSGQSVILLRSHHALKALNFRSKIIIEVFGTFLLNDKEKQVASVEDSLLRNVPEPITTKPVVKLTTIPPSLTDSCTIDLVKTDFLASNAGLQWWLEYYPAGFSMDNPVKRLNVFIRVSVVPVKMSIFFSVPGTSIRRSFF
uniref:MATH domain-containing protein n=1 Tax=Panagrellus redivivus TaxID=6233 RepID=A0A7E4V9A5_PANRE